MSFNLDKSIRRIEDFPKPGILFYDITSVLANPEGFEYCVDQFVKLYEGRGFNAIAAVEARGFIFGAPLALRLGLPLILVRKKGKLPGETVSRSFQLEYGEDVIEIHKEDIHQGEKILLVDDLIATGGTLKATVDLFRDNGATVTDVCGVIGLPFLNYKEVLSDVKITTLIDYDSE